MDTQKVPVPLDFAIFKNFDKGKYSHCSFLNNRSNTKGFLS